MSDIIAEQAGRVALAIFERMERASGSGDPILRSEIESIVTSGMRAVAGLKYEIALENAPPPRAPDWEELSDRYRDSSRCNCISNPPCSYCVDGWMDDIDWEHERITTGYVDETAPIPPAIIANAKSMKSLDIKPGAITWMNADYVYNRSTMESTMPPIVTAYSELIEK